LSLTSASPPLLQSLAATSAVDDDAALEQREIPTAIASAEAPELAILDVDASSSAAARSPRGATAGMNSLLLRRWR
jgi:Mg-chelatase subunit ChlD